MRSCSGDCDSGFGKHTTPHTQHNPTHAHHNMNTTKSIRRILSAVILGAVLCGGVGAPDFAQAKQGATDPIPGTSNGGTSTGGGKNGGGGGGGKSSTTTTTTTTTTVTQPIVTGTLTFTAAASVNNVIPQCSGSYRIDPYYPTLSLMTVVVTPSQVNLPDGSNLYITINVANGTGYPFTSNVITLTAQAGTCTFSEYITPGSTITSVVISDDTGAVVFAGN